MVFFQSFNSELVNTCTVVEVGENIGLRNGRDSFYHLVKISGYRIRNCCFNTLIHVVILVIVMAAE